MGHIDAEKLKEKIQPNYENAKNRARYAAQTGTSTDCARLDEAKSTYEFILYLIDSLQQEQPEINLEREIEEHVVHMPHGEFASDNERQEDVEWARKEFHYFFELGLNARKEG